MITNPNSIHEDPSLIPASLSELKDLVLLWLWCRLAAAALIRPLARELLYARGAARERKKERKKEKRGGREKGREGGRKEGRKKEKKRKRTDVSWGLSQPKWP